MRSPRGTKRRRESRRRRPPSQSAAAGAAAAAASSRTGAAGADASSASTVALAATSVQSGGRGGSGGYCVGRRLMSHGCVFLGRVFMWCLVPFFCGRDEHSTASTARPTPGSEGKPTDGRESFGAGGAAVPARSAVTGDMLACSASEG
nr:unnamed protein product [Digitaria exilis]